MNLQDLPDDTLVNIIDKYLNLDDLLSLSRTSLRFYRLINDYSLSNKYVKYLPFVDYNYPNGYLEYNSSNWNRPSVHKLEMYLKWYNNKFKRKLFYSFREKMLPHVQLDIEESNLYISEANELVSIPLKEIYNYKPSKYHENRLAQRAQTNRSTSSTSNRNDIRVNSILKVFERRDDIHGFVKKSNILVNFTKNKLVAHLMLNNNEWAKLADLEEYLSNNKIQCTDFAVNGDIFMIYGCSNGHLKIFNIKMEYNEDLEELGNINLQDRVLRCMISPSFDNIAVGTAGVRPYKNEQSCPMRIYDIENLKEVQILKPPNNKSYKHGAGILALSYIDEHTLIGAGYDTFVRVYDLRTNKCVQEIEEPEDMSIYCVCASKSYGLVTGNDRQSIVRYFDRRKARLIHSYTASNSDSSIYSLSCTPECIFAGWDGGVTIIDFI